MGERGSCNGYKRKIAFDHIDQWFLRPWSVSKDRRRGENAHAPLRTRAKYVVHKITFTESKRSMLPQSDGIAPAPIFIRKPLEEMNHAEYQASGLAVCAANEVGCAS